MKCYLCGSTEFKLRDGSVKDNKDLDILECVNCSLVFLSSIDHIKDDFYTSSQMSSEMNLQEWHNETYIDDLRRFNFVKKSIVNKNIVDFGSGAGGFLTRAKKIAKSVTGIEIDPKIVDYYKEKDITLLQNISDLEDNKYDLITAFHVLEHLEDPLEILKQLIPKLKKGANLIIEVPNSDDILLTLYKNKSYENFIYWSPHLFLFNSKTLNILFKLIPEINVDFIKHIQRYPLSNHLYWLANSSPGGHSIWGNFIDSPELTSAYEAQLASLNVTDTIIASIRKK